MGRYFPMCKYLVKEGFQVTIVALHSNFARVNERHFYKEGVEVFYVSQMHIKKEDDQTIYFNAPRLLWLSLQATYKLFINVLKKPSDVIVIGKPHPMNGISGLIGGFLTGAKVIVDCDDYEAASNYFATKFQQKVVQFFENTLPKLAHRVTTNTIFNQQRMIALGIPPEKIHYLPNGIDQERFNQENALDQKQIKENLGLADHKVIAYIGSLNLTNHPVDLLLYAFKIILEEEKDAILLIVGGGKDFELLKALSFELGVQDKIRFTGRVSPEVVATYYQLADISVDPVNNTEAIKGRCPLKIFESWAMGVPVVTSNVGDRGALGENYRDILLAAPEDSRDLAQKIISLLKNPDYADAMVKHGQEISKQYYWRNLVHLHLDIFS